MHARQTIRGPRERLTLLPHELALLLQVPRTAVLRMIKRGELRNASRDGWKRIAVEDARELIRRRTEDGECSPLAELLLEPLRDGSLRVSRDEARWLTLEAAVGRANPGGLSDA